MKNIKLYFDFLSPFSYFAWLNLKKITQIQEVEVSFHPVLMGRLFSHHEFPGPGEIPAKRDYELKKCFRYAHKNNLKFNPPNIFPFNPLAIIRMATIHASGESQTQVISEIFDLIWGEGNILEDPELIEKLLVTRGVNKDVIEKSFERQAKVELKTNIKDALERNIFGVPSFAVDNEFFWGNDSIDDLCNFLNNNDNWDKQLYNELSLLK
jgi:2-hydroxychromene-2-carboxylate isomerase